MDLKSLLNQALKSDLLKQGADALGKQTNNIKSSSNSSSLKTLGAGAVGGGLIGMLMGSKKSKKMTKKIGSGALKVGGAAALGALAYKVYNDWQAKQSGQGVHETFDPDDSKHSVLILKAMIGAAKADGHVDEEEMARIEQALADMGADEHVRQLVQQELNKPLDPAEIANQATSPQQASEIYLASLIVADEQNFMEKAYLQELAKQLQLSPEVTQQLEVQVQ
ncbi:tellurite resistance TerB family protein [Vibrio diabolicus]|uniref:tellurite resistance TerB family protein n=1 Tax=Vibrio TaxID=662 RepID=UPI0013DF9E17|nr:MULTISPECIES: tellurite resistance TerB family protein [Vibrio]MCR9564823.1 tellurite resistance TerB family protein [Vibrio alginolyticus]MCA2415009.1 tellurite resistance TerB family protein [Vibrio chemaguriensis]MCA2427048.1 tellurite resistance TerB family protein [Vibrio chemaguriensis]MCE9843226.1 tellurite resistance TerB family protein [Vibrio antiquarius]MCR9471853.1 tellurite resistance TerB family protein [Vibrio diabolicus]